MPHITSEVSNSPQEGSIIGLTDSITENPAGDYPLFFRGRRRLAPLPQKKPGVVLTPEESLQSPEKHPLGFEYGEHFFLGNSISLRLENGTAKYGKDVPLKLPNGIVLTYGNINGLAGDFYATNEPICDGGTFQEQVTRFAAAFNTLATGYPETKDEVKKILDLMQTEVDAVNKAIANKIDPSTVYPGLPNIDAQLQLATVWRWYKRTGIPAYLGISEINLDHFGDDARLAYLAGHYCACKIASSAKDLMAAYAINAFADHFLEDSFSAGHMRTPRRLLHTGSLPGDKCAKVCYALLPNSDCTGD
ncbi:hypothetical protein N7523_000255 [Penicillium sp. IBT 18751x]|nr:hypothetical protein N7523_000255 [Penicillium sp. IBT 18751x]